MYRNSHRSCSLKKVFLKILLISQENTCVGVSFLIKLQVWGPATLLKRDYNTYVFLWNQQNFTNTYFEEYLRTTADQMICNKILLEKIRAVFCIQVKFDLNVKKTDRKKMRLQLVSDKTFWVTTVYATTDSEHKLQKTRIENWLPIGFNLALKTTTLCSTTNVMKRVLRSYIPIHRVLE